MRLRLITKATQSTLVLIEKRLESNQLDKQTMLSKPQNRKIIVSFIGIVILLNKAEKKTFLSQ